MDDLLRSAAALDLVEGGTRLAISTSVLDETVHVLRTDYAITNPELAEVLVDFLSRENVELADADVADVIRGLEWSIARSARRIPDWLAQPAASQSGKRVSSRRRQAW